MGQTHNPTTVKGKSIGKRNETTPEQQAIKDATSKRTKQIDRQGYVEDLNDFGQKFSVQLCSNYTKTPAKCVKNATDKMWYQVKLDGLKGYYEDGKMMSRKAVEYEKASVYLKNELDNMRNYLIDTYGMVNPTIDGELFINNRFWLEDLNSVIKGGETLSGYDKDGTAFENVGPENVQFHICNIYDETLKDKTYGDIIPILKDKLMEKLYGRIHLCTSYPFKFDDLEEYMGDMVIKKQEGIVIYMDTCYKAGKTNNCWKCKRMQDAEWKITGFKETKTLTDTSGNKIKQFQHVCTTLNGEEFSIRMTGNNKHRQDIGTGKYIGKLLKIQHQGLFKTGKPVFPVGITVRLLEDL
jgi:hypothetical protein